MSPVNPPSPSYAQYPTPNREDMFTHTHGCTLLHYFAFTSLPFPPAPPPCTQKAIFSPPLLSSFEKNENFFQKICLRNWIDLFGSIDRLQRQRQRPLAESRSENTFQGEKKQNKTFLQKKFCLNVYFNRDTFAISRESILQYFKTMAIDFSWKKTSILITRQKMVIFSRREKNKNFFSVVERWAVIRIQ